MLNENTQLLMRQIKILNFRLFYLPISLLFVDSIIKLITMNEPDGKGEPLIHLYQYDQQDHALFHQLSNHICISSVIKYDL